jgi:hypothetical protein
MIEPVWTYEKIEWLPEKLPYPKNVFPVDPESHSPDYQHVFWHSWVTWWKDTFYITYCIFKPEGDPKRSHLNGTGALKSTSGKIEGPYVSLGKVGGQVGEPGPNVFLFHTWQGKLLCWDWLGWRDHVAIANLDKPGWKWDWKRVDGGIYEIMQRGDCSFTDTIEDVPIFCFHSSGPLDGGEKEHIGTYDVNYIAMETPWGPPRKDCRSRCLPHVGAANRFKDHKGYWWSSMFGSEGTAPWAEKFGLVALKVKKLSDGDIFIDVEDKPDDYQKKIMGGGKTAEIKTVIETLEEQK